MKKRKSALIAKLKRAKARHSVKDRISLTEISNQSAKSMKITYSTVPVSSFKNKKIHERKPLPKLPVAKQVPDNNPSSPLNL